MASHNYQDPSMKAEDILTDLINQTNSDRLGYTPFTYGQLKFRNVKPAAYDEDRDTTIQIAIGTPESDNDWLDIWYDRVPFSRVLNMQSPTMTYKPEYTSVYEMLEDINMHFGINVTETDLEDAQIAADPTEFPVTVPMIVKSTSLVYRGATAIYLTDPDSGTGIITPINTQVDVELAEEFTENGSMVHGSDNTITGFTVADNGEISVACSVALRGNTDPLVYNDGVAVYKIPDDGIWDLKFNFGLINTVNDTDVGELYDIRLFSPTHGPNDLDLCLYKTPTGYKLANGDNSVVIDNNTVAPDKSYVQNVISLTDYDSIVDTKSKNGAGSPLGSYEFKLTATRKQGGVPPVIVNFKMITESVAGVVVDASSPDVQFNTSEPGNTTTVKQRIRVTGPAGVIAYLPEDVVVDYEFSGEADVVLTSSDTPMVVNETSVTLPAGTAKGTYFATWTVTGRAGKPGPVSYTGTYGAESSVVEWDVVSNEQPAGDIPTVTAPPTLSGSPTSGMPATVTHATYESDTAAVVLTELDVDGTRTVVENSIVTFTDAHVGKMVKIVETITNEAGSVVTESIEYGPVAAVGVEPEVVEFPTISGDPVVGTTITVTGGVFDGGVAEVSLRYRFIDVTDGAVEDPAESVALTPWSSTLPLEVLIGEEWLDKVIAIQTEATNIKGVTYAQSEDFGPIEEEEVDPAIPANFDILTNAPVYSFAIPEDEKLYLSNPSTGKMITRYTIDNGELVEDTTFNTSGVFNSPCTFIGRRQNGDIIGQGFNTVAVLDGGTGAIKAGTTAHQTNAGNMQVLFDENSVSYVTVYEDPKGAYSAVDGEEPELMFEFMAKPLSMMIKDTLNRVLVATRDPGLVEVLADNGETLYGLLRFLPNNEVDTNFRFGARLTADNSSLVMPPFLAASGVEATGGYIVGGYHDTAETAVTTRDGYIALINNIGVPDPSFVCDLNGPVQYVQKIDDGVYMIAGGFTSVNDTPVPNVAFIDDTGTLIPADIFGNYELVELETTQFKFYGSSVIIAGSFKVNGGEAMPRISSFKVTF